MAFSESERATLKDVLDLLGIYTSKSLEAIKLETVHNDNFDTDVERFLGFGDIKGIIISPESFPEGGVIKKALIDGLTLFFKIAMTSIRVPLDIRHKLFACLYDLREHIDLLSLLEEFQKYFFFCGGVLDDTPLDVVDWARCTEVYAIFEQCYYVGIENLTRVRTPSEGKNHRELIASQQRIVHFLLLHGRRYGGHRYQEIFEKEVDETDSFDTLAAQIYVYEDVRIYRRFARKHLVYFMGAVAAEAFLESGVADTNYGLEALLRYITENGIPDGVGYEIIETQRMQDLYTLFRSEVTDKRFRLYALKRLIGEEYLSESSIIRLTKKPDLLSILKVVIEGEVSKTLSAPETEETMESLRINQNALERLDEEMRARDRRQKEETLLSQEEYAYWAEVSTEIVHGRVYWDTKKMISCNMEAEVLMTALVLAAAGVADIDLVKSMQRMPKVLSFPDGDRNELITGEHGLIVLQSMSKETDLLFFIDILGQYLAFKGETSSSDEVVSQLKERFLKD